MKEYNIEIKYLEKKIKVIQKKIVSQTKKNEILKKRIDNLIKKKKIPIHQEINFIYKKISQNIHNFIRGTDKDIEMILMYLTHILYISDIIFGATLAFYPNKFKNNKISTYVDGERIFAPYVFRTKKGFKYSDVAQSGYNYIDGTWEWWNNAINKRDGSWTVPYIDNLAKKEMTTYSIPIFYKRKILAVLTYDILYKNIGKICNFSE